MVFACRGQFLTSPGLFQTPAPRSVLWIFLCILNKNGTFTTGHWSANILIALFQQQWARPRGAGVVKMWRFLCLSLWTSAFVVTKQRVSHWWWKQPNEGHVNLCEIQYSSARAGETQEFRGHFILTDLSKNDRSVKSNYTEKLKKKDGNKCLVRCWW